MVSLIFSQRIFSQRSKGRHDHTPTDSAGPLHSGSKMEICSLCTAGPYLYSCYSLHICAQTLLLLNSPHFLSLNSSSSSEKKKNQTPLSLLLYLSLSASFNLIDQSKTLVGSPKYTLTLTVFPQFQSLPFFCTVC